jgi:lipid II:glycine glycyltransferase (peptidoglycan interpeptide bridge formation enzyme)
LSKPIEEQLRETSKNHRRDVRQALSKGLSVVHDPELKQLDRFVELYWDTMRRVGAASAYRFPMEYFRSLSDRLGPSVQAFHAVFDEAIVASSLIFVERDIVQYHLSGTSASFAAMSPSRVVLEHIRIWATENRYKWFHLGGGVGGREDSLFTFKARFSKDRCNYRVSKIVIDAALNSKLERRRREVLRDEGRTTSTGEFFPAYRDPGSDPSAATSIEGYK